MYPFGKFVDDGLDSLYEKWHAKTKKYRLLIENLKNVIINEDIEVYNLSVQAEFIVVLSIDALFSEAKKNFDTLLSMNREKPNKQYGNL
jgi:hypothetical protein